MLLKGHLLFELVNLASRISSLLDLFGHLLHVIHLLTLLLKLLPLILNLFFPLLFVIGLFLRLLIIHICHLGFSFAIKLFHVLAMSKLCFNELSTVFLHLLLLLGSRCMLLFQESGPLVDVALLVYWVMTSRW